MPDLSLSMQRLLLIMCLLFAQTLFSQRGFIYIKKNGFKKVRTFSEGQAIGFKTQNNQVVFGILALVKKDSIYVNDSFFAVPDIKMILLRAKGERSFPTETFLWTMAGVILSTTGMTLAKWANFERAAAYSAGIGYGNMLIRYFPKFKRKKYKIGKKFSLQTLDLHF